MGIISKLKTKGHLVSRAVETAEYAGAAYALGWASNKYREKLSYKGLPADLLIGIGAKVAAIASDVTGYGHKAAPHLDILGNVGIACFFHTLGSGHGADSSGVARLLVPHADVAKAKAVLPASTVMGSIPQAAPGKFLTPEQLSSLAR